VPEQIHHHAPLPVVTALQKLLTIQQLTGNQYSINIYLEKSNWITGRFALDLSLAKLECKIAFPNNGGTGKLVTKYNTTDCNFLP